MEIRFSRDYKHNYMIIRDDRILKDNYQLRMLTNNNIEGLCRCQERMINGEGLLYYDVSSKQPIKNVYLHNKIRFEDVKIVFEQLAKIVENNNKYLLKTEEIILNPEYVFQNMDTHLCDYIYYPYYKESNNDIELFLNFFVENVCEDDLQAVEVVYQLAEYVLRQQMSLEEALKWFTNEYSEAKEESIIFNKQKENVENTIDDIETDELFEEEEELSLFQKIIKWIKGEKTTKISENYEDLEETFLDYKIQVEEKEDEGTVYIPWVENSEQKLYGVGKNNKFHIDLRKLPVTVGKLSGAVDLVISDNSISRMHARFSRQGNKCYLQDLNSTNGSYVNGERLNPNQIMTIEPGDEIGLGKLKFIYR